MIITFQKGADQQKVSSLISKLEDQGVIAHKIVGEDFDVYGLVGNTAQIDVSSLMANPAVFNVQRISQPYKLANRQFHPEDSIIQVGDLRIGDNKIVVMAGPCSVESEDAIVESARVLKELGADMLRGGAYKPRTSPYAFQGMGYEGIKALKKASDASALPTVSELMSADKLDEFIDNIDVIQIGARNMQNFDLLKAVGKTNKPVLLKRGLSNTIEEWLMAAEYIMSEGNPNVILCERGIRTFEPMTRNTLDLSVIPIIKQRSHLPIVIDPSHATGDWRLVESQALAAIAAGADGLILEVHEHPEAAFSDGGQSLKPEKFERLMKKARKVAEAIDRTI